MKALITGIIGQDGSYLSEFLLSKGYEVHGIIRRNSQYNTKNIEGLDIKLHYGDLTDSTSISNIIKNVMPNEIYNLGAFTHVGQSFQCSDYVMQVNGLGCLYILEAIKQINKSIKFYQASTSELMGDVKETPQNENTPFNPVSPYGIAKQVAYYYTKMYRNAYNLFACNGILFNHESSRRGEDFVSKKIVKAVVNIANGSRLPLILGNLDAKRDWGYAKDYVEAMWLMLQKDFADDYVIATGETHTVREFVELAFKEVNIDIEWRGSIGYEKGNGRIFVEVDEKFYRPLDVNTLCGDYSKAVRELGWKPRVKFKELVKLMVGEELEKD